MQVQNVGVLIIGGGPAGLAAAIAVREAGFSDILVLEREDSLGGILNQCIHNGFGLHRFKVEMTGPEYAYMDIKKIEELNIPVLCDTAVLSLSENRQIVCINKDKGLMVYNAGAVILAMGCRERPCGALGIAGTHCAGVYNAGTAQKFINLMGLMPGKNIVILGSGDIGLIMARRLTLQGANVKAVVEIMPYSSGLNRNIVQCLNDYGIPLYLNQTVTKIVGGDRLEAVVVQAVDKNKSPIIGTEILFECDTLLLSVGLIPENELSQGAGVELSQTTSGPIVSDDFQTNKNGIFACGNVLHVHDLVDFVSEEGAKAGRSALDFINGKTTNYKHINVLDGHGVRGCVPQTIRLMNPNEYDDIQIMFRPDRVYENVKLIVKQGDDVLLSQKKRILTPGEMAELVLKKDALTNLGSDITISIEA